MCQHIVTKIRMVCDHLVDSDGIKIVCEKDCGVWTVKESEDETRFSVPCDPCIDSGLWIKKDGVWEVKEG
ncbi:hypothetical protein K461DRAFT_279757 [Myriangium duriaei CBS 260.36]|uniref:Uncharacterized protein n=1 Tax=Myriangium duriaei CBS 260.36 TaxID=1168546 RepID=A0A9P4J229_9PEZI|nr:hypothetical protein K461DRAFT_279757 [Myriangium duriaei CBS 260.36]